MFGEVDEKAQYSYREYRVVSGKISVHSDLPTIVERDRTDRL